jgi:ferredoxin
MKALHPERIQAFFTSLAAEFDLRLPILLPDGTRTIGSIENGPIALHGGAVPGKPSAAFFPQQGQIFSAVEGTVLSAHKQARQLLVVGFTHRDIDCLRFMDRFFADGWRDDIYFSQRHGAVVAGVSGYCGAGGALLPMIGGGCDLEFIWDGSRWLVETYSEIGESIAAKIPDTATADSLQQLKDASLAHPDEGDVIIRRASELLRTDQVPDSFWGEIGDRCILCTSCNLVCPTCTCFGVQDLCYTRKVERSRMWDSCQLDGFMREASGHNPLGSEALRTRRRIHHKLAADPEKWGEISCFLCGRCDAVCPTGIGILAVARELVERYGGE